MGTTGLFSVDLPFFWWVTAESFPQSVFLSTAILLPEQNMFSAITFQKDLSPVQHAVEKEASEQILNDCQSKSQPGAVVVKNNCPITMFLCLCGRLWTPDDSPLANLPLCSARYYVPVVLYLFTSPWSSSLSQYFSSHFHVSSYLPGLPQEHLNWDFTSKYGYDLVYLAIDQFSESFNWNNKSAKAGL